MPGLAERANSRTCASAIKTVKPFTSSVLPPAKPSATLSRRAATAITAAAAVSLLPLAKRASHAASLMSDPSISARNMATAAAATPSSAKAPVAGSPANLDLLVVGPGVLGSVLAKDWLASVPGSTATGLTNTNRSHDRLRSMGITPATRDALSPGRKWSFVAFSAPPSGSQDYTGDVGAALAAWDGTGSFVFTSSMSVCAVDDNGRVSEEHCPLVEAGAGPSTDKLLMAEAAVLEAGGNVVRLVGLYHANRGAHTYFMKMGTVPRPGGYVVNLLHYEDAAGMAAAILRGDGSGPFRGRVFLGTDGNPVTFQDMMEVCFTSGAFPRVPVNFTGSFPEGSSAGRGKVVDNTVSRAALGGWAPLYPSFGSFMQAGGKDFYNSSGIAF